MSSTDLQDKYQFPITESGAISGTNGLVGSYKFKVVGDLCTLTVAVTDSDSGTTNWIHSALIAPAYRPPTTIMNLAAVNDNSVNKFILFQIQSDGDLVFSLFSEGIISSNANETDLISERYFSMTWHVGV